MQGISIFERGKTFYASFDCPKKLKRVTRSTGFKLDSPDGKAKAYKWARENSMSGVSRSLINKSEAWAVWVQPWIDDKFRNQPATLISYTGAWKFLSLFFLENEIWCPRQLDHRALLNFVGWRTSKIKRGSKQNISRNTALHNVTVLSRIMRQAIQRGYASNNPCHRFGEEVQADPSKEKPEFTNDQIALIRKHLKKSTSNWMRIAFEISIHQGCRLSACAMPFDRIDFERNTIRFHEKGVRGEKTIFTVPLHPKLRPTLLALKASGATETCQILNHASRNFGRFLQGIGIEGYSFHCCRVTVITRMARAGVPIQQAMAYVHHADTSIHKIYIRLSTQDLGACSDALAF
jgi:integrase